MCGQTSEVSLETLEGVGSNVTWVWFDFPFLTLLCTGFTENDDFALRMMNRRRSAEFQHSQAEARRVTQSISIKKPPMLRPLDTDSPANSPGSYGSSPPASPSLASPSPSSRFTGFSLSPSLFFRFSFLGWCCFTSTCTQRSDELWHTFRRFFQG